MTAEQWINDKDDILLLLFCVLVFVAGVMVFVVWRSERGKEFASGGYANSDFKPTTPSEALVFKSDEHYECYKQRKRVFGLCSDMTKERNSLSDNLDHQNKLTKLRFGIKGK